MPPWLQFAEFCPKILNLRLLFAAHLLVFVLKPRALSLGEESCLLGITQRRTAHVSSFVPEARLLGDRSYLGVREKCQGRKKQRYLGDNGVTFFLALLGMTHKLGVKG